MDRNVSVVAAAAATAVFASFLAGYCVRSRLEEKENVSENDAEGGERAPNDDEDPTTCSPRSALDLIRKRRSIFPKQYTGRFVPRRVIDDMLEAARWAPTHHLTEPWEFVVYESAEGRESVGRFLAERYEESTRETGKEFSQAKYDKKMRNAASSSHVIALSVLLDGRNPDVEEVSSLAMAVQNMLLVAAAYGAGAYWSTGGIYDNTTASSGDEGDFGRLFAGMKNPVSLRRFLGWADGSSSARKGGAASIKGGERLALGWLFLGDFLGSDDGFESSKARSWPQGRRKVLEETGRVSWK